VEEQSTEVPPKMAAPFPEYRSEGIVLYTSPRLGSLWAPLDLACLGWAWLDLAEAAPQSVLRCCDRCLFVIRVLYFVKVLCLCMYVCVFVVVVVVVCLLVC